MATTLFPLHRRVFSLWLSTLLHRSNSFYPTNIHKNCVHTVLAPSLSPASNYTQPFLAFPGVFYINSNTCRSFFHDIRQMKIYTKTGDEGQTSLFNGERVSKHNTYIDACGTVDECNCALGMACSSIDAWLVDAEKIDHSSDIIQKMRKLRRRLYFVQNSFFKLGAHLATPITSSPENYLKNTQFNFDATTRLEEWIDEMSDELPPLTTFILPGGHPAAASLQMSRTICRRAERLIAPLYTKGDVDRNAFTFINRASDFFFQASRYLNFLCGIPDVTWDKEDKGLDS